MKSVALPVILVNPAPDVSTCRVALAISWGEISTMADIRPVMERGLMIAGASTSAHHVLLHSCDHFNQAPPGLFHKSPHARDVFLCRQLDRHIGALFGGRCEIGRWPWWRRRLLERGNLFFQRRHLIP